MILKVRDEPENTTSIPKPPFRWVLYNLLELTLSNVDLEATIAHLDIPKSVERIDCSACNLNVLPGLPLGLRILYADHNHLTALPNLPDSLEILVVEYNNLKVLTIAGNNLVRIDCGFNDISEVRAPNAQQIRIRTFQCTANRLTSLPDCFRYCLVFTCAQNRLDALPPLPWVEDLDCRGNVLQRLPRTLYRCRRLSASGNRLRSLPPLPLCEYMDVSDNRLAGMPPLPRCRILVCQRNQLRRLPSSLDSCSELYCAQNRLTELPRALPRCLALCCQRNQLTHLPSVLECGCRVIFTGNPLITYLPISYLLQNIDINLVVDPDARGYLFIASAFRETVRLQFGPSRIDIPHPKNPPTWHSAYVDPLAAEKFARGNLNYGLAVQKIQRAWLRYRHVHLPEWPSAIPNPIRRLIVAYSGFERPDPPKTGCRKRKRKRHQL